MNMTTEQLEAVKRGEAVRVPVPEIGKDVVLVSASTFDEWQDRFQDEQEPKALREYAKEQAARVARENPYR